MNGEWSRNLDLASSSWVCCTVPTASGACTVSFSVLCPACRLLKIERKPKQARSLRRRREIHAICFLEIFGTAWKLSFCNLFHVVFGSGKDQKVRGTRQGLRFLTSASPPLCSEFKYCDVDWKLYSCCTLHKTINDTSFVRTKETPWNKSQSGVLEKRMKTTTMMTRTPDLISYSMAFTEFIRKHCTMQWISAVDDMFLTTRILKQYCLVSRKKESQRGALERYYQSVTGVVWDLD